MTRNAQMVELWNSDAAATWSVTPERYDAMLEGLGARVLAAAALQPGERVLDVGCGAGQLTRQAAEAVGAAGSVLAVDIASDLVAVARRRAEEAGLAQVEVLQADAQEHAFESSYDAVISRFGVMFFDDPGAAFANLLRATAAGGRLAFVCWQPAALNEWASVPLFAVAPHVGWPEPPVPDAPGPFAFGDPDRLRGILTGAGWSDVGIDDIRTTLRPGGAATPDEAVTFFAEDAFGKMLLAKADPEQRAAALAALREAFVEKTGASGVELAAAVWVVTARRG